MIYSHLLELAADVLDDIERTRIANENRLRQLTRTGEDKDGGERGFELNADDPQVKRVAFIVRTMLCDSPVVEELYGKRPPKGRGKSCCMEHDAIANLTACLKQHPLNEWVKSTTGIGEKQGARLLAAVGDPYWNDRDDCPRTLAQLWSYCGYAVVDGRAPFRQKTKHNKDGSIVEGTGRVTWNPTARMRVNRVAEQCKRTMASPYRAVYEDARKKYAGAVHKRECHRCTPKGHPPAPVGSPLKLSHEDARGVRVVAKEILRDMWSQARDIHAAQNGSHDDCAKTRALAAVAAVNATR